MISRFSKELKRQDMRKLNYILIALTALLVTSSCYDDKGNYKYTAISDIDIEGIENSYVRLAAVDRYNIKPTITTSYPENELVYTWEVWDSESKRDTIAHGPEYKDLDEIVGIAPGTYRLFYYVKHVRDGEELYSTHVRTSITVNTEFSTGFYILKETTGGDTDLDMMQADGRMAADIISNMYGAPIGGKPRSLGMLYSRPMIDKVKDKKTYANCLGVVTYDGNANIYRAEDMAFVYDQTDMFYDPTVTTPYKMFTGYYSDYLSGQGMYHLATGSPGSGLFGLPIGETGGSDYSAFDPMIAIGIVYWDETNSRILFDELYTGGQPVTGDELPGSNHECLFMGSYTELIYGIFRNKGNGDLEMYTIYDGESLGMDVIEAGSKIHGAASMATNETDAEILYIINDNKLYIRDIQTGAERPVALDGIDDGEQITYIAHRYFFGHDWMGNLLVNVNYLAVATQQGDNYNLYMYDTFRGTPEGEPVMKTSGTGKFRDVQYLDIMLVGEMDILMAAYGMGGALFSR